MSNLTTICLLCATFFWGISFIATKIALGSFPPLTVVTLRLIVSAICFLLWFGIREKRLVLAPKKLFWQIFLLSLVATTLHFGFQTIGLRFTTATNASVYAQTAPVFIIIISAIFLNEKITFKKILGIVLAIGGVVLVMGPEELIAFNLTGHLLGDILVLTSFFLWGVFTVYSKKLTDELKPLELTSAITIFGALTMLPISLWEIYSSNFFFSSASTSAWLAVIFLGVTCSFLATIFYIQALKKIESQKVGIFMYFVPLVTFASASLFLGEMIGVLFLIGAVLIISGVFITERG